MASFLNSKWVWSVLTVGEVEVVEAGMEGVGTAEAGMEGVGTAEAGMVVRIIDQELEAVTEVVLDLSLAGEILPGCRHLQARGTAVIVDVVDMADRVVGMRWMILRRGWRR